MDSTPREIPLSQGKVALVSPEDYERVAQFKWAFHAEGYAVHSDFKGRKQLRLHRFILGLDPDNPVQVDHINGDRLNNTRSNLRVASAQENNRNRRKIRERRGTPASSAYKGVYLQRRTGRWCAAINPGPGVITLGSYATAEDAALVYDAAACQFFGEFAVLNFPGAPARSLNDLRSDLQRKSRRERSTGYRGAHRKRGKWHASICIQGRAIHLGSFDTPEEAAQAYDAAVRTYRGPHAFVNFPED